MRARKRVKFSYLVLALNPSIVIVTITALSLIIVTECISRSEICFLFFCLSVYLSVSAHVANKRVHNQSPTAPIPVVKQFHKVMEFSKFKWVCLAEAPVCKIINPFNASCSKMLLFGGSSAILVQPTIINF